MSIRGLVVLTAAAVVTVVPAALGAAAPQLFGTVGPGASLRLDDASGNLVTKVDPGSYEVVVRDLADEHNFHLTGPGVNETTQVEATGTVTWAVTLVEGTYNLFCDVHPLSMRRTLTAGNPPPPAPAPAPTVPKLLATVGPNATISLRSASGAVLRTVKRGTYSIVVRDRSKLHNFHLVGAGVNRKSGLAATGTLTWKLKLSAGTLRFFSDRSPAKVRGSIRVT